MATYFLAFAFLCTFSIFTELFSFHHNLILPLFLISEGHVLHACIVLLDIDIL